MKNKLFLGIDGSDGSGKTTLIKELKKYYEKENKKVVHIHFPRYDTEIGEVIKKVLTNKIKMNPAALQMLYSSDRVNFSTYDFPKLEKEYDIIIADRYTTSGLVYGQHDGLVLEEIIHNELRIKKPNLYLILCADVDVALNRINSRNLEKTKYEKKEIIKDAIEKYKNLKNIVPDVYLINSNGTIPEMTNQAIDILEKKDW
ncbi:MAG: dTMP kinase [bacterium]